MYNSKNWKRSSFKNAWRREMMQPHDDDYVTYQEVQEMISKAIDKHNKTATIISAAIGSVLLFFYAHGVLAVVDKVK